MKPERAQLENWRRWELMYADAKFHDQRILHDAHMAEHSVDDGWFWFNQIFQYVKRAQILGLETPSGRQALAKCWMTLGGAIESAIRVYGDLPMPGVPSGEIQEWQKLQLLSPSAPSPAHRPRSVDFSPDTPTD